MLVSQEAARKNEKKVLIKTGCLEAMHNINEASPEQHPAAWRKQQKDNPRALEKKRLSE